MAFNSKFFAEEIDSRLEIVTQTQQALAEHAVSAFSHSDIRALIANASRGNEISGKVWPEEEQQVSYERRINLITAEPILSLEQLKNVLIFIQAREHGYENNPASFKFNDYVPSSELYFINVNSQGEVERPSTYPLKTWVQPWQIYMIVYCNIAYSWETENWQFLALPLAGGGGGGGGNEVLFGDLDPWQREDAMNMLNNLARNEGLRFLEELSNNNGLYVLNDLANQGRLDQLMDMFNNGLIDRLQSMIDTGLLDKLEEKFNEGFFD